jgi:hypothetical protein
MFGAISKKFFKILLKYYIFKENLVPEYRIRVKYCKVLPPCLDGIALGMKGLERDPATLESLA